MKRWVWGGVGALSIAAASLHCSANDKRPPAGVSIAADAATSIDSADTGPAAEAGPAGITNTVEEAFGCSADGERPPATFTHWSWHTVPQPAGRIIPLCGDALVMTNPANKALVTTVHGVDLATYDVGGAPVDIALDIEKKRLFVLVLPKQLVRVDLATGDKKSLDLPDQPLRIEHGKGSDVIVSVKTDMSYGRRLFTIDTEAVTIASEYDFGGYEPFLDLFAYEPVHAALVIGAEGLSGGGGFARWEPDADAGAGDSDGGTPKIRMRKTVEHDTANCSDLQISPDAKHVFYVCGGGNSAGYTITDFRPDDLATLGEFATGAYPSAAAYRPDVQELVASPGDDKVITFSVSTHQKVTDATLDIPDTLKKTCSFPGLIRLAYARNTNGGVTGLARCLDSGPNPNALLLYAH